MPTAGATEQGWEKLQERLASRQPPRPWVQGGSTVPPGGQLEPRQEELELTTGLKGGCQRSEAASAESSEGFRVPRIDSLALKCLRGSLGSVLVTVVLNLEKTMGSLC